MSLPRKIQINSGNLRSKSEEMQKIKETLEKAKNDLIVAQKEQNHKRAQKLQEIIANLTGTIERNS